jgi:hypothetical protein
LKNDFDGIKMGNMTNGELSNIENVNPILLTKFKEVFENNNNHPDPDKIIRFIKENSNELFSEDIKKDMDKILNTISHFKTFIEQFTEKNSSFNNIPSIQKGGKPTNNDMNLNYLGPDSSLRGFKGGQPNFDFNTIKDIITKIMFAPTNPKNEHIPESMFPILYSMPKLLRFSKIKVTENTEPIGKDSDNTLKYLFNQNIEYQTEMPELGFIDSMKLIFYRNIISG